MLRQFIRRMLQLVAIAIGIAAIMGFVARGLDPGSKFWNIALGTFGLVTLTGLIVLAIAAMDARQVAKWDEKLLQKEQQLVEPPPYAGEGHLSDYHIAVYVLQNMKGREYELATAHLADCPDCREIFNDVSDAVSEDEEDKGE